MGKSATNKLSRFKLRKRFGLKTLMVGVTLSGIAAAAIAQPLFNYQVEQSVIRQVGAVQQEQMIQPFVLL